MFSIIISLLVTQIGLKISGPDNNNIHSKRTCNIFRILISFILVMNIILT
jgi:hypothetical protein